MGRLHRAHLAAGANVVTTATFAAGAEPDVEELARAAHECATLDGVQVWGSVGPIGDIARVGTALAQDGVDVIALETFLDGEALVRWTEAFARAGSRVAASWCPVRGHDAGELARRLVRVGAYAVGAGCGDGIHSVEAAASSMRDAVQVPVFARPSAGIPVDGVHPIQAPELAAAAERLRARGIAVGGCCGVDEGRLRAMHAAG